MAIVFADRVKVRSHSTGTGTLTLESVVSGFQSFEAVGNGNETYYGIEDATGNWEVGIGTYTHSGTTLSRDTVISSSNSNALVNFPAGAKNVFTTIPSSVAANIIASTTYAFRDIEVAGQSTVIADSTADTLTLVAGTNIDITTNSTTDTITINSATPSSLEQGMYNVSLETTGSVTYPGDITQSAQDSTSCPAGVDTVIYTSTGEFQHAIKLFVMVEGFTDGGGLSWDTQACDIIAVKGYNDNVIHVTVYGVTYTGSSAIAEFDGQWNATSSRIEITCRPVSVNNDVTASVHAFEMSSNN